MTKKPELHPWDHLKEVLSKNIDQHQEEIRKLQTLVAKEQSFLRTGYGIPTKGQWLHVGDSRVDLREGMNYLVRRRGFGGASPPGMAYWRSWGWEHFAGNAIRPSRMGKVEVWISKRRSDE
jgi:hypothetical protein